MRRPGAKQMGTGESIRLRRRIPGKKIIVQKG